MLTLGATLKQALAQHRAGQLRGAEALYRQVLEIDPANFDACYGLGVALHAQGRWPEALASFAQAVRLRPDDAEAWLDQGTVLGQLGRFDESVASLKQAARLAPSSAIVADTLAQAIANQEHHRAAEFLKQDRLDDAAACCRRIVELLPASAVAHESLGKVLHSQGKLDEAAACFHRAIERDERCVAAHHHLGLIAMEQKQFADAENWFRRTLALKPELIVAHNDLGAALSEQEKLDEAETCFRHVLELEPAHAEANNNLGTVLAREHKGSAAVICLERAIQLKPDYAEAFFNLGKTLRDENSVPESLLYFRRALDLKPDYLDARIELAFALLTLGRFKEGWPHYEFRWQTESLKHLPVREPRWKGDDLAGRTILLGREQGFGDTLQFVRYAELLERRGGRVVVECFPQVATLVKTCPGVADVAIVGEPVPKFDVFAPLLSLPGILGTTLETIPSGVPYLHPDRQLVEHWRGEFARNELKVGIAWQGNPEQPSDQRRSIPLSAFEPIAHTPGVRLFSLQFGEGREQLADVADDWPVVDLGDVLGDFHNTAAIMSHLDLVITCDSAPAHLAGALGLPFWVALRYAPDWRWMLGREDSPWYPTARLFRQTQPGEWPDVFAHMAEVLAALAARREGRLVPHE